MTEQQHEEYITKHAPDLRDQLATFRDREFGDINGEYEGEFDRDWRKVSLYSVTWNEGVRYSYTGTEGELVLGLEMWMDGYGEGRR